MKFDAYVSEKHVNVFSHVNYALIHPNDISHLLDGIRTLLDQYRIKVRAKKETPENNG